MRKINQIAVFDGKHQPTTIFPPLSAALPSLLTHLDALLMILDELNVDVHVWHMRQQEVPKAGAGLVQSTCHDGQEETMKSQ